MHSLRSLLTRAELILASLQILPMRNLSMKLCAAPWLMSRIILSLRFGSVRESGSHGGSDVCWPLTREAGSRYQLATPW